ncbi:hypothetical protein GCM10010836_25540 [Aminobacter aminovorans]
MNLLSVAPDHGVDDVVDGDDTYEVVPGIDHRHGKQVVFGDQAHGLFERRQRRRLDQPTLRHGRQDSGARIGRYDAPQRHGMDQGLP